MGAVRRARNEVGFVQTRVDLGVRVLRLRAVAEVRKRLDIRRVVEEVREACSKSLSQGVGSKSVRRTSATVPEKGDGGVAEGSRAERSSIGTVSSVRRGRSAW